jgi:hypothetical protein
MAAAGTVGWIPDDSRHGRAWGVGQRKEDDEGIQFYTLLVAEMHRGGGFRRRICGGGQTCRRCGNRGAWL